MVSVCVRCLLWGGAFLHKEEDQYIYGDDDIDSEENYYVSETNKLSAK